jgi:hypothetical protein
MKKTLLSLAVLAVCGGMSVRASTRDVAFTYRMGAGFPGDVNRTHPASILPGLVNVTTPPLLYGNPVLLDTASYRQLKTTDTAITEISGVLVRPYPVQQTTGGMSASIGAATPPVSGVCDVINEGFVLVTCGNFAAVPCAKGGAVYVWIAASTGNHVQGTFEAGAGGAGDTILLTNARWNNAPDASGVAEVQVMAA